MSQTDYVFSFEPEGYTYRALLAFALNYCTTFLLVTRKSLSLGESGSSILTALDRFKRETIEGESWPGTVLFDEKALIHHFHYDQESASVLSQAVNSLYQWIQPEMPEDLCLLRPDKSVFLSTTSHEGFSILSLLPSEKESLEVLGAALIPLIEPMS